MTKKQSSSSESFNLLDKLPAFLDIGWGKFKFERVENLHHDEEKCFGLTDFNHYVIKLEAFMDNRTAYHTILHEVFHVYMETFGLGGYHKDEVGVLQSNNEHVTESCARAIMMLREMNPELWTLLFEEYTNE